MKHYIYPADLRRTARKYLWSVPVLVGLLLLLVAGMFVVVYLHSFILLGVTVVTALLTAHIADATLWEYGCCAVRFWLGQQILYPEE